MLNLLESPLFAPMRRRAPPCKRPAGQSFEQPFFVHFMPSATSSAPYADSPNRVYSRLCAAMRPLRGRINFALPV